MKKIMVAKIIDGKAVAQDVRNRYKTRVAALKQQGINPGLAVILVGNNPASKIYVRNKIKACEEVGLRSELHEFAENTSQDVVLNRVQQLNDDPKIHGILVQLPLPPQFELRKVLEMISPEKDVDGFHLYNVGALVVGSWIFPPCTPYGVQCMLEHEHIPIEGQNVVVIGASNIVGKPMALMLMQKDATVSICHIKTRNLKQYTLLADILIVAAGSPKLVTADMVKPGAVVIDVGINKLPDGRIVGDVDFEAVREIASHISPVPGGVGPMTVAMLIGNTVQAAERSILKKTISHPEQCR